MATFPLSEVISDTGLCRLISETREASCGLRQIDHVIEGGDEPVCCVAMLSTIQDSAGEVSSVVMVLHDINLAARYADHLFALRRGRLVASGPPSEVITRPSDHCVQRSDVIPLFFDIFGGFRHFENKMYAFSRFFRRFLVIFSVFFDILKNQSDILKTK